jgi:hypothetical protein
MGPYIERGKASKPREGSMGANAGGDAVGGAESRDPELRTSNLEFRTQELRNSWLPDFQIQP